MGRFETTAEFYHHREPYPPEFFASVAARLALSTHTRMLDVACGPANLAIGFASHVGSCLAVDREPEMLRVARMLAAGANTNINFLETGIEDLESDLGEFDFVTIGRALHWLPRERTLAVLERVIAPGGQIAICGSTTTDSPINASNPAFKELRRRWASDPNESRYRVDTDQWFAPSRFRRVDDIAVTHRQTITIPDLIGRALSFSITSPAVLGERRQQFETAMRQALEPFAVNGTLEEELVALATIFE